MSTQTEVVYPSTSAFSGTGQLDMGPYFVPLVNTLLRAEVRGKLNFQAVSFGSTGVEANTQLWAVQWVSHGSPPNDVVTTADGPHWLIREQVGHDESRAVWAPSTALNDAMIGYGTKAEWAGQLAIGASIDLYLSMRAPTGFSVPNFNYFGSLRFWWS